MHHARPTSYLSRISMVLRLCVTPGGVLRSFCSGVFLRGPDTSRPVPHSPGGAVSGSDIPGVLVRAHHVR